MHAATDMAMLAEVVKESPYAAGDSDLDAVDAIVAEQATRDAYRGELAGLLASYRALR